jgi:glycosyltransferase involved in cell wall biosynthesis
MKKISIIIPAWNEEGHIATAISALKKQNFPREDFEIIVVDNNSSDNTRDVAQAAGADLVLQEKEQGTNMARNCGLRSATGEILAFLDADCEPPTDWLSHIVKNFENAKISATSGPYDYGFKRVKKYCNLFYTHFVFVWFPDVLQFIFRKKAGIIIGGNFAVRKSAIQIIGEFPRFRFFGDDTAIATVLSRRVGKVFFDPTLIVKSSPRRMEKRGVLRTTFIYIYHFFKVYFTYPSDTIKRNK